MSSCSTKPTSNAFWPVTSIITTILGRITLWTTTPLFRASSSLLGGEGWLPSPKSAVCIIATRGQRSLVPVHHTASRRTDDRERPGGRVKTESLFLFPSVLNRIRGLDTFAFAPRGVAHRPFWRRFCRPTRFSDPQVQVLQIGVLNFDAQELVP